MKNIRFIRNYIRENVVDLIETNNFENLRFFRTSHNIFKELNFGFSILFFFKLKRKTHIL